MKKKFTFLFVTVCLGVSFLFGFSACDNSEFTEGLDYILNGETYSFAGIGEAKCTEIVIPSTYEDVPITEIGDAAFKDCKKIKSVSLSEGITKIGVSAFYNCNELTSIIIPDTVTSIGASAFGCCWNLTSISLPKNITEISASAFSSCFRLRSISISEGVTEIGMLAFKGCSALQSVEIPNSVIGFIRGLFQVVII